MQNKKLNINPSCKGEESGSVRELMDRIGDTWSMIILANLYHAPNRRARFSELEKMIAGVSQRMLSLTLKSLERDGLIKREVFPEVPPRVKYELTDLGESILYPLQAIIDWVLENFNQINEARIKYDQSAKKNG